MAPFGGEQRVTRRFRSIGRNILEDNSESFSDSFCGFYRRLCHTSGRRPHSLDEEWISSRDLHHRRAVDLGTIRSGQWFEVLRLLRQHWQADRESGDGADAALLFPGYQRPWEASAGLF